MDSNSTQLCRLCLLTSDSVVNIWETLEDSSIASILEKHFWFQVHKNDGLTEWLCQSCWIQTKTFHEFYVKVERYHKYLLDSVEKDADKTDEMVDGKEETFKPYLSAIERVTELTVETTDSPISKDNSQISKDNSSDHIIDDDYCDQSETDEASGQSSDKKFKISCAKTRERHNAQIREFFTLKCEICSDVQFESFSEVEKHYRTVHKTKGYVKCCGKKILYVKKILEHIHSHQGNPDTRSKLEKENALIREFFNMKCEICSDVEFESFSEVDKHYRMVHKTKGFLMCCGKKILYFNAILDHIQYHQSNPDARAKIEEENAQIREFFNMKCEICSDVEFQIFLDARKHYRKVHNREGYLKCCGNKFRRRHLMLSHVLTHTNPDAYRCDQCSKCFRTKHLLESHIDNHVPLDSRAYKCSLCPSSFAKGHHLTHHVKNKHSSKTGEEFPCDKCDKSYRSKLLLKCHIRNVHEFSLGHVCEICARAFKSKQMLRGHIRTQHTTASLPPEPKVQCDICGDWFKHKAGFRAHVRRMHQDSSVKALNCAICNKVVKNKYLLNSHIQYAHGERRHQCVMCGKAFKRAKILEEHIAGHTGEYLYNCPYCEKKFKSNANMYSHRKKAHLVEWTRDSAQRAALKKNATSEIIGQELDTRTTHTLD